jgi:hypothetical protein
MAAGVLPFTPSLVRFTYVLIVLVILLVAMLAVLFHLRSLKKRLAGLIEYVRKPTANANEQPTEDEVRSNVSILLMILNWMQFPWRLRRIDTRAQEDLERGRIERENQSGHGQR